MTIAIIDYGAGNLHSARKAFELGVARSGRPQPVAVTSDPDLVAAADRIVLPGDGAFRDCKSNLERVPGMIEAIAAVIEAGRPFFGICVGMQLLASWGLEHGRTRGLDRIGGEVRPIAPGDPALKVPHMGWNTLTPAADHKLLAGIPLGPDGWHAFFLHAYELVPEDHGDIVATADYGGPVTAVVARGNVAGTQFHPEKSQKLGLALIGNFLAWKP